MWKYIKTKSEKNFLLDKLSQDIIIFDSEINKRHFNEKGKNFFYSLKGLFYLRFLLNLIKNDLYEYYQEPLVDHAYLLTKSPGGNQTPPHQDFLFWANKENTKLPKKMITFWFALCDIYESNGSLKLIKNEETVKIKDLNKGNEKKLKHKNLKVNNSFSFTSENLEQNLLLKPFEILKGNCIAFDSYSLHGSTANISGKHRLALKIVTIEKNYSLNKKNKLNIKNILSKNKFLSIFYIYIFWIKIHLNNIKTRLLNYKLIKF